MGVFSPQWASQCAMSVQAPLTTPLHSRHLAAGGKLVPFAGWHMPVQYTDIQAEHLAVRHGAGVFDVSHMGQIETQGPDAVAFLQRLLSNDVERMPVGGAQYAVLCRPDGGVLDDLFTYRLAHDSFLTVTNAANHARDLAWFESHAGSMDVAIVDRHADYAMLAVQGPDAREIVRRLSDEDLPVRMHHRELRIGETDAMVCGTGYTGEDGVEILLAPDRAGAVWDALLQAGVSPAGLGARDTLRLEVCFHLYGNDLMESRGPIEAGLGWCCKEATGFIGSDAVARTRQAGPSERLVAFTMPGGAIARPGNPVIGGGEVTSGTLSPSLQVGIGMAYVPAAAASEGTELEIDVRGKVRRAVVVAKPIYRREAE
ncbi:MAG TPA: glycine cleavage system aminomethyltransferase GcvT [Solirubrobacteraceae bacterium]